MTIIQSPCQRICILTPQGDFCLGCGRSPNEIRQWIHLTENERQQIMDDLPERLTILETQRKKNARLKRAQRKQEQK